jgi:hypothetical protein
MHPRRPFWQLVHPDDEKRIYTVLSELILNRCGVATLRCGIRTSFQDYFLPMNMTLKYGTFGVICSLWELFQEKAH